MICGDENDSNGCHLAVFSVDIAFACQFVVTHPSSPYSSAMVLATPVKKLPEMANNSDT